MPQVFGCPNCQNPFQVPDDAAGKAFQCPTCEATVEVPASVDVSPEPSGAAQDEREFDAEVFSCPHCSGQFGVDESMYGQKLTCPHCDELVAIGEVPQEEVVPPIIQTASEASESATVEEAPDFELTSEESPANEEDSATDQTQPAEVEPEEELPLQEPVFEPQSVDHLLPPQFDIPDPKRFPTRLGSDEVILPDGDGGYRSVDANIVTITHNGQLYQLKRMTPDQRRRRKAIHNTVMIGVAILLIYLTLRTLGVLS
jgi:DNA-directed RNA polymerase subunit M/transcription elongation factor TFIIS